MSLRALSDKVLLSQTRQLTHRERETTLEILKHLNEIERRRLHLRLGYGSLFTYCTEHLGYSASGSGRRVQVARCIRRYPQAGRLLRRGRVNLTTLSMIVGSLTPENAGTLLLRIEGRTQREVEAIASELRPLTRVRDRVKPVCVRVAFTSPAASGESIVASLAVPSGQGDGGAKYGVNPPPSDGDVAPRSHDGGVQPAEPAHSQTGSNTERVNMQLVKKMLIQFAASTEFMTKVEKVRSLLSTKLPEGASFEQVFEGAMDAFIEKHDPEMRVQRRVARSRKKRQQSGVNSRGRQPVTSEPKRHIPPATRDAVYVRDGGRCTYRGVTGKRCGSRHNLHLDHVLPFAHGGSNVLPNLRLLCANHNRLEAVRLLGPVMSRYTSRE